MVTKRQRVMNTSSARNAVILTITISMIIAGVYGAGENLLASAKKPQTVIEWSNGFPSGEHGTINIHGKKPFFNCDNSDAAEPFGSSIFVPIEGTSEINFVSNKRASGFNILRVLDPCADPFGNTGPLDPALIQLEAVEMQVYWRILGKPNNSGGGDPSAVMLTHPKLIDACNFLPAFADNSVVGTLDPDAQAGGTGLVLSAFAGDEKHENDSGGDPTKFDVGETIYRDVDGNGFVSVNDIRLANASTQGAFADGSVVADGDPDEDFNSDAGRVIVNFNGDEKHENDSSGGTAAFDLGETVYLDVDGNGFVSVNDIRLANAITQGFPEGEGGEVLDCTDASIIGLGLITNKGAVFKKTEFGLERFEDPEPVKGKGKSKAIEITDLFTWSGVICNAAVDTDGDDVLEPEDFGETEASIAAITGDFMLPLTDAEFQEFLATQDGCQEFIETWIFIIADIVLYGFDYENKGSVLTQMRFYPTATLTE